MTTFPLEGDCLEILRSLDDNSVDAVVTDPPYGLAEHKPAALITALTAWASGDREHVPDGKGFMGRDWDAFVPPPAVWDECLRVLKPGGYLLAFAGSRTTDLMGLSVRMAGFEIRDTIMWVYGSGFPKSKNIGGGLGTALKPAQEPIIVARKPLASTVAGNVLAHGTGALNIDACRVGDGTGVVTFDRYAGDRSREDYRTGTVANQQPSGRGRWPSNVVLTHHPDCADPGPCTDGCPVAELDQQSGTLKSGYMRPEVDRSTRQGAAYGEFSARTATATYGDSGGASRFFPVFRYQAKAPARERPEVDGAKHPTVKPLALMQWLVRLVTPPGGIVLDPFAGSGTTLEAARAEGFDAIGIERDPAYYQLILRRLGYLADTVEVAS